MMHVGMPCFRCGCAVQGIAAALEAYTISDLKNNLKLHRHMDQGNAAIVAQLLSRMTQCAEKFSDWHPLVRTVAHTDVAQALAAFPPMVRRTASTKRLLGSTPDAEEHLAPEGAYYDLEAEHVVSIFHSDVDKGLSNGHIERRVQRYGINELPRPKPLSDLELIWRQLKDVMIVILLVAAGVSVSPWRASTYLL